MRTVLQRLKQLFRIPACQDVNTILEAYVNSEPSNQTAVDIGYGEWWSALPEEARANAGSIPVFDDGRIHWLFKIIGGVSGMHVLELGPLEGAHSYMLEQAGAESIMSIEANTRAYLKCLVVKELLGLSRVRYLCGDFNAFLEHDTGRYDLCLASGVLYHMAEPARLIELLSRRTDLVYVWTNFYDASAVASLPDLKKRLGSATPTTYAGFSHTLYRHDYLERLQAKAFCGGGQSYSNWMTREDILACFKHFGFDEIIANETSLENQLAPCFDFIARKSVKGKSASPGSPSDNHESTTP